MEQALRRIERRPLSIASELRGGATHFDHANASVEIEHGVARIQRAEGVGAGVSFDASGSIAIPARALALHVRAWSVQGDGDAATDRTQLKMDISGAWNAPSLVLDTQSLIQHSKAAAPLWSEATQAAPAAAPSADLRQSP